MLRLISKFREEIAYYAIVRPPLFLNFEAMKYPWISCLCFLAVLYSAVAMIVHESSESFDEYPLVDSVNITINDIYVGVIQSITPYKHYGNYSFSELSQTEEIAALLRDLGSSVTLWQRTGQCKTYDAVRNFVDLLMEYVAKRRKKNLMLWKGVFLNDCEEACEIIGRLGAAMNGVGLPVISYGCGSPELSDLSQYKSFARVNGMFSFLAEPMAHLFHRLSVSRVVIVSNLVTSMEKTQVAFTAAFRGFNINTLVYRLNIVALPLNGVSPNTLIQFAEAAKFIRKNARYVVLLLKAQHIVRFLKLIKDEYEDLLNGEFVFFTVEYRIVTVDDIPDMSVEELASIQERLVTGSRKPFASDKIKQSKVDHNSDLGYVLDAQLILYSTLQYTKPVMSNSDIIRHLHSDSTKIRGNTGSINFDAYGTRRPEYIFLIVQDGQLMPLWTVNSGDSSSGTNTSSNNNISWINPKSVKWPLSPFPPNPNPECVWDSACASKQQFFDLTPNTEGYRNTMVLICCAVTIIFIIFGVWLFRKIYHALSVRTAMERVIKWSELTFHTDKERTEEKEDTVSLEGDSSKAYEMPGNTEILSAVYQNFDVAVKLLPGCPSVDINDKKILEDIRQMRAVNHENIVEFIGICIEAPTVAIVMLHTQRGSLQDVIFSSDSRILSLDFMASLLMDVCKGMEYLHQTEIGSHGNLRSTKCLVDMRWTCRISGYGMGHFIKCQSKVREHEDAPDDKIYKDMMYIAPELLRLSRRDRPLYGTKEGDVYSFAIILQEAVLVSPPYAIDLQQFTGKEIISQVRAKNVEKPFRPSLGNEHSLAWIQLIKDCWEENKDIRPTFHEIHIRIEKLSTDFTTGFIEKLMLKLEQHALNLQEMVRQATERIVREKAKADTLLYSLLPKVVADDLKQGKVTEPETFDSATIFYSDIVGFTKIAAMSTPMQIVEMLNSLYREYDAITDRHDAYKVETIGDSYMVVSGVPVRNGQKHALEIALLAVESLEVLSNYKMRHLPGITVQARIGIHSGLTLAGVVGLKMPRYCLFGETVVIASKMESTGEANKIHISNATAELLTGTKGFVLESRGEMEIIKEVTIKTYFLRRNSKEEVFAWVKQKMLPYTATTVTSTTPVPVELSPYMEKQEQGPPEEDAGKVVGHDGRLTENGIIYVFSAKEAKS